MNTLFDFKVKDAKHNEYDLGQHKGHVVLVVNVASQCGFTPQYKGLEELYKRYHERGLVILGFPCNQFGSQEPGSDEEVQKFCSLTYAVTFPVLGKIDVNGPQTAPAYKFLKEKAPGLLGTEMIKWNFTKFLVNRQGEVIKRYAPNTEPADIASDIEKALSNT
jgi:glutathione peroxidase